MASTISCASCSDDLSASIRRMLRLARLIAIARVSCLTIWLVARSGRAVHASRADTTLEPLGDHVTDSRSSIVALSDQLADAVAAASASVVAVHARPRLPSTGVHWR